MDKDESKTAKKFEDYSKVAMQQQYQQHSSRRDYNAAHNGRSNPAFESLNKAHADYKNAKNNQT